MVGGRASDGRAARAWWADARRARAWSTRAWLVPAWLYVAGERATGGCAVVVRAADGQAEGGSAAGERTALVLPRDTRTTPLIVTVSRLRICVSSSCAKFNKFSSCANLSWSAGMVSSSYEKSGCPALPSPPNRLW